MIHTAANPAYIISYARTPMGRSYKGSLKSVTAPAMFGFAVKHAVKRSGIDKGLVDDVIMGCALPEGTQYYNIGWMAAMAAGLPEHVPGMTMDSQCSSGMMTVVTAAMQINSGQAQVVVAGGGEQLTLVQNKHMNTYCNKDVLVIENKPGMYMSMLETAENVAKHYNIDRTRQDEFAYRSQMLAAGAHARDIHTLEIAAMPKAFLQQFDPETKNDLTADETPRPTTTLEGLAGLTPVLLETDKKATVTAGNACCFADAAGALLLADQATVKSHGLTPKAIFHGVSVAGCDPGEMGVGPKYAVPKLLKRFGLTINDIDLWELNEAFASQALYCIDELGLDLDRVNVNGGAIALGHPYGMSGARLVGAAMLEGEFRQVKYAVITMCIGGGQGAAGLIEILPEG